MQAKCYRMIYLFFVILYIDVTFWATTEYRFDTIRYLIHPYPAPDIRVRFVFVELRRHMCCLIRNFTIQFVILARKCCPLARSTQHLPKSILCNIVTHFGACFTCCPVHPFARYACVLKNEHLGERVAMKPEISRR